MSSFCHFVIWASYFIFLSLGLFVSTVGLKTFHSSVMKWNDMLHVDGKTPKFSGKKKGS